MGPFIKLEEPHLKNLPTGEETKQFEEYMNMYVTASNMLGSNFDGSGYFKQDETDDLAFVFEKALSQWCEAHKGPLKLYATKEVSYKLDADGCIDEESYEESYVDVDTLRDACFDLEQSVKETLNKTIKEHLERTGGNIGHFPYSGKRVLLTFTDDDGDSEQVKLDPFDLDWTGIHISALMETADFNHPKKKQNAKNNLDRSLKKRFRVFVVSAVIFIVTFLVALLIKNITEDLNLVYLMLVSDVISISAFVAVISLFLTVKKFFEIRNLDEDEKYNPLINDGFETHMVNVGTLKPEYESYGKFRFEIEVMQMHKYLRFMQTWADSCNVRKCYVKGNDFYTKIAPFVVNGKSYL